MPVSKAELARALALLKELLIHAENNGGMDSSVLEPLELTSETIGSELFLKLVDAQNSQSKNSATLPNEDWSGGVKLLPTEYPDHFSDESDHVCSVQLQSDSPTKSVSIDLNAVLQEELSPASILPSSKLLDNDFHQQAQEIDPSLLSTAVNTKLLQNYSKPNTVSDGLEQNIVKEEVNFPSSIEHLVSTEDHIKSEGVTQHNVADLLSPLRDGKTLLDIKQALHGKHGRDIRYVALVQSFEGLGMELVGLIKTGTYIASLSVDSIAGMSGLLKAGDQILDVNGTKCDDMASFEIAHQIENVPVDKEIVLGVIYNPIGLKEFQRLSKNSYTK